MTEEQLRINLFRSLRTQRPQTLRRLELIQDIDSDEPSLSLTIHLCVDDNRGNRELRLAFTGVQSLKVDTSTPWHIYKVMLEIYDVRGDQCEGVHCRVVDSENEILSFYAAGFSLAE